MQMWKASTSVYENWINFQNICCVSKLRKSLQEDRDGEPCTKTYSTYLKFKKIFHFELQQEADAQSSTCNTEYQTAPHGVCMSSI